MVKKSYLGNVPNRIRWMAKRKKQEKEYRHLSDEAKLNTRLMFYDLILDVTFE